MRSKLTAETKLAAVERVVKGKEKQVYVAKDIQIKIRTLKRLLRKHRDGVDLEPQRRGPAPALPRASKDAIAAWDVARQRDSHPVDRSDIIIKAQQVCVAMGIEPMKDGWFRRFKDRYPDLVDRLSQTISRVRNEANEAGLEDLFYRMAKVVIEGNYDASSIFNMDETAFANRQKTKRVIALRGSKSVHNKSITTNFHLTLVVCCAANGSLSPSPHLTRPTHRRAYGGCVHSKRCAVDDERIRLHDRRHLR
jgi:transposase-like protein